MVWFFSKPSISGGGPGAVLPIRVERDQSKFEIRISKFQTNSKSEFSNGRNQEAQMNKTRRKQKLYIYVFGLFQFVSDFGLRI